MSYDIISMKSIAKQLNDLTYTDYYYRLMLLARSVFKWENLPNGISEKWIERYLFNEGQCLFFNHKELGFMVTKCGSSGSLNYYDEPTKLQPIATNLGTPEAVQNYEEGFVIMNNDSMIPTTYTIQLYALRLAEITRTMDININAQKMPVIIKCSERQRLTLKNVMAQWQGNEPAIYGDKNLDSEEIKALKIDAPAIFDKLQIQKNAIWNECMTFLGINNANQDKRERLVADEVAANDCQIEASANVMLKAREEACQRINERWGLDIRVSLRNIQKPELFSFEEAMKEGVENV